MRGNITWNLAGVIFPMIVGLISVPQLLVLIGPEKLGILSIAWMLIGYFGVLDLGLGRALTRAIGEKSGHHLEVTKQVSLSKKATKIMIAVGFGWMLLLLFIAPWIANTLLNIPAILKQETTNGFMWLACAVPFMLYSTSRIAILEGQQRFQRVNSIKIPLGIATFIAPLSVAYFDTSIEYSLASLLFVRVISAITLGFLVNWPNHISKSEDIECDKNEMRELFKFGGWLTVSNIVSPILAYFDRFFIGSALSMAAVAYYTIPYDVLVRLTAAPIAIMGVLFPLLTRAHKLADDGDALKIINSASRLMFYIWLPGIAIVILIANNFLTWWVGVDMKSNVINVWYILAIGVFYNGISHLPYNIIQSTGRSDITAKLHIFELPIYLILISFGVFNFGIEGAAFAWCGRVFIDFVFLFIAASVAFKNQKAQVLKIFTQSAACILLLIPLCFIDDLRLKVMLVLIFSLFAVIGMAKVLKNEI